MLESQIQIDPIWQQNLDEVLNEHGFDEQLDLTARAIQFVWHVQLGASTIDIKKHIQTLKIWSYSCRCSATLIGQKKARQKSVCTMRKKCSICGTNQARTLVLPGGLCQTRRGGEETTKKPGDKRAVLYRRWLTYSNDNSHPLSPATASSSLG